MRTKKLFVLVMILTIVSLMAVPPAIAGRGCEDGQPFTDYIIVAVDKTAPGTKYNVTLTLYYQDSTACPPNDMYMFARVKGNTVQAIQDWEGNDLLSFGGTAQCIQYSGTDGSLPASEAYAMQREAVEDFFTYVVNPGIYAYKHLDDYDGCDPDSLDPEQVCPEFAIKSITNLIEDGTGDAGGLRFMVLDLVLAIQN